MAGGLFIYFIIYICITSLASFVMFKYQLTSCPDSLPWSTLWLIISSASWSESAYSIGRNNYIIIQQARWPTNTLRIGPPMENHNHNAPSQILSFAQYIYYPRWLITRPQQKREREVRYKFCIIYITAHNITQQLFTHSLHIHRGKTLAYLSNKLHCHPFEEKVCLITTHKLPNNACLTCSFNTSWPKIVVCTIISHTFIHIF